MKAAIQQWKQHSAAGERIVHPAAADVRTRLIRMDSGNSKLWSARLTLLLVAAVVGVCGANPAHNPCLPLPSFLSPSSGRPGDRWRLDLRTAQLESRNEHSRVRRQNRFPPRNPVSLTTVLPPSFPLNPAPPYPRLSHASYPYYSFRHAASLAFVDFAFGHEFSDRSAATRYERSVRTGLNDNLS